MNKSQLIEVVAKETGYKKKEIEQIVTSMLDTIENTLVEGEKVQLVGFGTFEVKTRKERIGRNPATGDIIPIAESKRPSFTAGKILKDKINK